MLVHFGIENICAEWRSATVVVGTFDGVHLGHRELIACAAQEARRREQPTVVVTFDRHPASVLAPDRVPPQIGTLEQNVINMREAGASACVILRFDASLSRMPAQRFFDEILLGSLRADQIVVGHDFAFGNGREGTAGWLSSRIETVVVPPYEVDGQRVSSSLVRQLVSEGQVQEAARHLGRPFAIAGVVVAGQKRGRALGYPTLNLARSTAGLLPAEGVYAGDCRTPLGVYSAAISVGRNETFAGERLSVESHLLDYPGDSLYAAPVEVRFHRRLRAQEKFANVEELVAQMSRDVAACR